MFVFIEPSEVMIEPFLLIVYITVTFLSTYIHMHFLLTEVFLKNWKLIFRNTFTAAYRDWLDCKLHLSVLQRYLYTYIYCVFMYVRSYEIVC